MEKLEAFRALQKQKLLEQEKEKKARLEKEMLQQAIAKQIKPKPVQRTVILLLQF